MKNLLGALIVLGVIATGIYVYSGMSGDSDIKTIIGISGTVMEGNHKMPDVEVKTFDASNSNRVTLQPTPKTNSVGKFSVSNYSVDASAIITTPTCTTKTYALAYVQFPAGNANYTEDFDFAKSPPSAKSELDIVLSGAANAYAISVKEDDQASSERLIRHNGEVATFKTSPVTKHYVLNIFPLDATNTPTTTTPIKKEFYVNALGDNKQALIYIPITGLPK